MGHRAASAEHQEGVPSPLLPNAYQWLHSLIPLDSELTPTMSLRRSTIAAHFAKEIEVPPCSVLLFVCLPLFVLCCLNSDLTCHLQSFYQDIPRDSKDEEDAETGRKSKLTDGMFYKKLADGSFEKTDLKQSVVEGAFAFLPLLLHTLTVVPSVHRHGAAARSSDEGDQGPRQENQGTFFLLPFTIARWWG